MKPSVALFFGLLIALPWSANALSSAPSTECKSAEKSVTIVSGYKDLSTIAFHDDGYVTYSDRNGTQKLEFKYVSSIDFYPIGLAPFIKEFIVRFEQGDVLLSSPIGYFVEDCLASLRKRYESKLKFTNTRI